MKFETWKEIEITFDSNKMLSFRKFIDIMRTSGNLPRHLTHKDTDSIIREISEYFYMKLEDE